MYSTLISATDLKVHLGSPGWIVVDCRFELARPEAGRAAYLAGHIPGAVYANLDSDLSGARTTTTGRHPLPHPATLARALGSWGIDRDAQVIAYDAENGSMAAARLWWLLKWMGHDAVAILDGGMKGWQAAGLPLTAESTAAHGARFEFSVRNDMVVTAEQVELHSHDDEWRILDARAPERYAGEVEPIDPVAGHVPGAVNHPFSRNLSVDGRFLPPAELQERLQNSLVTVPADHAIVMCGSGVTAAHTLLALEAAGLAGAKLYAGSWSEWITNKSRPIALGKA